MLTLSRRKNERVVLDIGGGQQITLVVVEVLGDRVRLGIEAPREVTITRPDAKRQYPRSGRAE